MRAFLVDWAYRFGRWTAVAVLIFVLFPLTIPLTYPI